MLVVDGFTHYNFQSLQLSGKATSADKEVTKEFPVKTNCIKKATNVLTKKKTSEGRMC